MLNLRDHVDDEIAGRQADLLKQATAETEAKEEDKGSIEDFRE
jgi:hypothetical protein